MSEHIICVVGNPNCGKTTLFNALTGSRQSVGNWPGVTVEKKVGTFTYRDRKVDLVDLPGIYSITPSSSSGEDERVARDYILTNEAEVVINIVDASNLERNLYLTAQLLEMRVPMIVVVNMMDIAKQHRIGINIDELQKALGCPVVATIASRDNGKKELLEALDRFLDNPTIPPMPIEYPQDIVEGIAAVTSKLSNEAVARPNWFAIQFLEGAPHLEEQLPNTNVAEIAASVAPLNEKYDGDLDIVIADARYQYVAGVAEKSIERLGEMSATLTDKIDRVVLNRWLGIPIFLFVMYLLFLFTQNLGAAFIDFFDILFGGIFVDGLGELLSNIGTPDWLRVFLANGVGGGIQTVSTFIPVIFFLYLFLAFLEDSGYMARAAFVMDRLMRTLGLPGKAFVPLIVGFGCNVPSIMATRTMDRASDRIITVMMSPFMSCGARLPVYVLFATAFFPHNGQNLVFALYLIGIFAAILTGFLLKRTALPGAVSAFVMEIPPYHIPTFKGVMLRTWDRVKSFIVRAGRVIVIICAILGFLNSWGTDGSFGNEDSNNSVLSKIGQTIVPVLQPMGVQQENWPAAVGIFTGIFAKEAVVGTLNSLYGSMADHENASADDADADQEDEGWSIVAITKEAVDTVIDNLSGLGDALTDPMGIKVDDSADTATAAEELEVSVSTIGMLQNLFGSQLAAFSYLLMVLLYMPCVAAIAAVYREIGAAWATFASAWTTVLGYVSATVVYRAGTFSQDPVYSTVAILCCALIMLIMYFWMKTFAKRDANKKGTHRVIPINSAH